MIRRWKVLELLGVEGVANTEAAIAGGTLACMVGINKMQMI